MLVAATVLLAVGLSFFVSASAGLGGSLILVPALALVLGTKEGVALAALLLAGNNVVKLFAYRETVPLRRSALLVVTTAAGAFVGSSLLVLAPSRLVGTAVIVSFGMALLAQRRDSERYSVALAPALAFAAGATSGFSGTSGPLKGVAIKSLRFDRLHMVGCAALVSFFGDATKAAVFADAQLLGGYAVVLAMCAVPLMLVATYGGRHFNGIIGEHGYDRLFWGVMGGYTVRLILVV